MTTPQWINSLSTASIAADMAAADVNGTVTYSGLKTLLTDLDAKLASSKTGLTTAELSDLKTIVANLNNGMTTSSYLTGIMNALVNGNAANATWTGGAASSTALGNLAAGSSATQLSELTGKWFLGTDLPSSTVSMSGYSTFSVSYSASSSPLFAASGPSMNDVNQGYLGDCYLLSGLAEVAKQNSGFITSMFTSNGNNTYGVRFFVNGVADYVTVNNSLTNNFNSGSDIWASLAEKAYAQLQAGGVVTGNSVNYGNSWSTIGNGGAPECALEEITGASAITDFSASGGSWATVVYNQSFSVTKYTTGGSSSAVLATLAADLAKGDDVVLSSYTNARDSSGRTTLVADHAMSVYGYDGTTGMLEIRNPWGSMSGQYWDTTFEVSLSTLLSAGDTITADNVGNGVATAPIVSAQTATQTWKLGQAVNFALPSTTFTDPQGQKLTYAATLSSGAALPSWLSFNTTTATFTGTVPNTTAGLSLKVTATDTSGLSASETFSVQTPATAPILVTQTATQTWKLGQAVSFALPANTFTDPQAEKLTYAATLSTGAALPSWLSFNTTTGNVHRNGPQHRRRPEPQGHRDGYQRPLRLRDLLGADARDRAYPGGADRDADMEARTGRELHPAGQHLHRSAGGEADLFGQALQRRGFAVLAELQWDHRNIHRYGPQHRQRPEPHRHRYRYQRPLKVRDLLGGDARDRTDIDGANRQSKLEDRPGGEPRFAGRYLH